LGRDVKFLDVLLFFYFSDTRLMRRLQQIEKLGASKKRQLLQIIDTFIEAEQLKQKA